jgi:hypothetical protein
MMLMQESALMAVRDGRTTVEDVARAFAAVKPATPAAGAKPAAPAAGTKPAAAPGTAKPASPAPTKPAPKA